MSSPLQNRVTPWGDVVADPARGTFMGNRGGRFHDDTRRLGRARWRSQHWIICVLSFKGRHREVMGASYTELFFLDEVTALAAGHRPCFECRRADANRFAELFDGPGRTRVARMDRVLHQQRLDSRPKVPASRLPDGAMFALDGDAYAVRGGQALEWSAEGYGPPAPLPPGSVQLLTPKATVSVLSAGYAAVFHPTARR